MSTQTLEIPTVDTGNPQVARPRVLPGLRLPVLPSGPLLAQVLGGGALAAGTFLQFGVAVTLIVSGAAAVLLGMLKEAGKI